LHSSGWTILRYNMLEPLVAGDNSHSTKTIF